METLYGRYDVIAPQVISLMDIRPYTLHCIRLNCHLIRARHKSSSGRLHYTQETAFEIKAFHISQYCIALLMYACLCLPVCLSVRVPVCLFVFFSELSVYPVTCLYVLMDLLMFSRDAKF